MTGDPSPFPFDLAATELRALGITLSPLPRVPGEFSQRRRRDRAGGRQREAIHPEDTSRDFATRVMLLNASASPSSPKIARSTYKFEADAAPLGHKDPDMERIATRNLIIPLKFQPRIDESRSEQSLRDWVAGSGCDSEIVISGSNQRQSSPGCHTRGIGIHQIAL
jgi:hypothetical protein